ncbi:YIP1 family protein [Halodesulfovibrio marinisediminis]
MIVKLLDVYVRPTHFFATRKIKRLRYRGLFLAVLVLMSIPFVRIGLGNLVGLFGDGYFAPYSIVFAFSLWQTPMAIMWQQVMLVPFYALGLVFSAAFLHFLLWMARGKNASYAATMMCVCYAVPCLYLSVFPYSGTITAVIYTSIFLAYSLKAVHQTKWSRVLPVIALNFSVLFVVCRLLFS